jgi:hypothetical protein
MAETFFAVRAQPNPKLISVGSACSGPYVTDSRASKAKKTIGGGSIFMERASSTHPNAEQPKAELVQALEEVGSKHPPDRGERLRLAVQRLRAARERGPMSFRVCGLAWQRESLCTTSVSGSTIDSANLGWPSPTYWAGNLKIHPRRLR